MGGLFNVDDGAKEAQKFYAEQERMAKKKQAVEQNRQKEQEEGLKAKFRAARKDDLNLLSPEDDQTLG